MTPTPITIQTAAPGRGLPAGAVASAYYIVDDNNKVVLTYANGRTLHDPEGREYARELGENDNPRQIAAQLLRSFRSKVHGDRVSDFNRPLVYPRLGKI